MISNAVSGVRQDVEAGTSLAQSMEAHPQVFDPLFRSMVRSGESSGRLEDAARQAAHLHAATGQPTFVGFGIDSKERAAIVARAADGVVVGSAIVRRIEEKRTAEARVASVRELVGELRTVV